MSSALPASLMKKPSHQPVSKVQPQQLLSSSSDGQDSGSESKPELNSDSDGSDPILSLIAAKAREGAKKPNGGAVKPRSKPGTATKAKSTGNKRAAERKEPEATGSKRSKKKNVENSDKTPSAGSQKQILFEGFFSEADEIAILKGVIAT